MSRTYVLLTTDSAAAVMIDVDDASSSSAAAFIDERGAALKYIVLTHEHYDHVGGVKTLQQRYDARLVCSRACADGISNPRRNFSRYLAGADYTCGPPDDTCEDLGWKLRLDGIVFDLLETPGHSPGSICIAAGATLFSGDTLIHDARTVTKLPGGDKEALARSLARIRSRCRPGTQVYPGHGDPFPLAETSPRTEGETVETR